MTGVLAVSISVEPGSPFASVIVGQGKRHRSYDQPKTGNRCWKYGRSGRGVCVEVVTGGAIVDTAVTVFSITDGCPAKGVSRGVEVGTAVASIPVVDGCGPTPQAVNTASIKAEPTTQFLFLITKPSVSPAWTARAP